MTSFRTWLLICLVTAALAQIVGFAFRVLVALLPS